MYALSARSTLPNTTMNWGFCAQEKLVKVGRKLKKNNVAVDVVAFGSEDTNGDKLEALIEAVNSDDNSHLVSVPAGTILSDILFGSPIFQVCLPLSQVERLHVGLSYCCRGLCQHETPFLAG